MFGQLDAVVSWSFDKSLYACKGWIEYFLYGTYAVCWRAHCRILEIWHTPVIVISAHSIRLTSRTGSHSWWCRRLRTPPPQAPRSPSPGTTTRPLHTSRLLTVGWILLEAQFLTRRIATNNLLWEKRWNPAQLYNC